MEGGDEPVLSCEQCLLFRFLPFLFAFAVGCLLSLSFEFCVFVVGLRQDFQSEWPFIIIIIITIIIIIGTRQLRYTLSNSLSILDYIYW